MIKRSMIVLTGLIVISVLLPATAKIGIVVNKDLYSSISTAVQTYIADVNAIEKKSVWLNAATFVETNTIKQLRDTLLTHYTSDSLEGVVFIGDLPIPQYEIENDYGSMGYAQFPTDYYYMDLNGTMLDNVQSGWGKQGVFDAWSGDKAPEIWVSRITPGAVTGIGTEAEAINSYFARAHKRMSGDDTIARKYLILGDDGVWPDLEAENRKDIGYATADITAYKRPNDTKANWSAELKKGYEYAYIYEHSGPTMHCTSGGYFYTTDYLALSPTSNVRFYNLYACSNARFITNNFGGLYAFSHNGLMTVGSTKTGSMLSYSSYNKALGEGKCFGEAFKAWVATRGITNPDWHYGMTLQGAGTLKLQPYSSVGPYVTVSAPNGGEEWETGKSYAINWNDNIAEQVKIELIKGAAAALVIAQAVASVSPFNWTIPTTVVTGSDYKVRISSIASGAVVDESNAPFSIKNNQSSIQIQTLSPYINSLQHHDGIVSFSVAASYGKAIPVSIRLYSTDGRLVRTVVDKCVTGGNYRISLRSQTGSSGAGIYLCRMETKEYINTIKVFYRNE